MPTISTAGMIPYLAGKTMGQVEAEKEAYNRGIEKAKQAMAAAQLNSQNWANWQKQRDARKGSSSGDSTPTRRHYGVGGELKSEVPAGSSETHYGAGGRLESSVSPTGTFQKISDQAPTFGGGAANTPVVVRKPTVQPEVKTGDFLTDFLGETASRAKKLSPEIAGKYVEMRDKQFEKELGKMYKNDPEKGDMVNLIATLFKDLIRNNIDLQDDPQKAMETATALAAEISGTGKTPTPTTEIKTSTEQASLKEKYTRIIKSEKDAVKRRAIEEKFRSMTPEEQRKAIESWEG